MFAAHTWGVASGYDGHAPLALESPENSCQNFPPVFFNWVSSADTIRSASNGSLSPLVAFKQAKTALRGEGGGEGLAIDGVHSPHPRPLPVVLLL